MAAWYNEPDPYAAQWLRNLIDAGHIAPGVVDERYIQDVQPSDLAEFAQCHFFAGIGVWSLALRQAGWSDDKPVWTGSCPCQPFSSAGAGAGFDDERHLWPAFHHLIAQCRPDAVLGEQVASKDALAWLDLVQTDMEATGYSGGAVDLCAAGFGTPHIRQRLYFVWLANADSQAGGGRGIHGSGQGDGAGLWAPCERPTGLREVGNVAHHHHQRPQGQRQSGDLDVPAGRDAARRHGAEGSVSGILADASSSERRGIADGQGRRTNGSEARWQQSDSGAEPGVPTGGLVHSNCAGPLTGCGGPAPAGHGGAADATGAFGSLGRLLRDPRPTNGFWGDADWLLCRGLDRPPAWHPVEPGSSPLVAGAPGRVGRLRAYGNALNAETATGFVEVVMEYLEAEPYL